jgi:hypothetical protein
MRISVGNLRRIIREELVRTLVESKNDDVVKAALIVIHGPELSSFQVQVTSKMNADIKEGTGEATIELFTSPQLYGSVQQVEDVTFPFVWQYDVKNGVVLLGEQGKSNLKGWSDNDLLDLILHKLGNVGLGTGDVETQVVVEPNPPGHLRIKNSYVAARRGGYGREANEAHSGILFRLTELIKAKIGKAKIGNDAVEQPRKKPGFWSRLTGR